MIDVLILILILVVFSLASYEDIKKREVYDYLNYFLVFAVLTLSIVHSVFSDSSDPLKFVGFGLLVGFALGSLLYYFGIWGGGDAKFLIGFSASSYYLLNFINLGDGHIIFENIFMILKQTTRSAIDYFLEIILYTDIIFLFIVAAFVIFTRDNKLRFERFFLFTILFLLFSGIYFNLSTFYLILIGFFSFVLMFFAPETVFSSVFFKIKKSISELKLGDKIDGEVKKDRKILIDEETAVTGIGKGDISLLEDVFGKDQEFYTRMSFPFGMLIGLNYIVYMFRIVSLSNENLRILFFMFEFLFISFLIGGILAILIMLGYVILNYKKTKIRFKKFEKSILIIAILLTIILTIYQTRFALLFLLISLYLIIRFGRDIEKVIFVKKKPISQIVPGDWISEDVVVDGKIVYKTEDFKLGVNEKQLEKIKKLSKKYKNFDSILVKDGLAFLPPLFLGFIIMLLL